MAGRPFTMEWRAQDTVAALHERYRSEAAGEVRTRLHGLWLLRQGRTMGEVATLVGVHYRTVQRWVDWYRQGGLAEVCTRWGGGRGQPGFLTAEQAAAVKAEVATGTFHTAGEVRHWIAERFGVRYGRKGIYSLLARLNCRPKVPRPVHAKADLAAQEAWKKGARRPPSAPLA